MLDKLTCADLAGHVNETFRLHRDAEPPLELILVETTEVAAAWAVRPGERRPFSLIFRGPRDVLLPQRTYRFEHDRLGAFEIFIVPIGPDEAGHRYEAVFN